MSATEVSYSALLLAAAIFTAGGFGAGWVLWGLRKGRQLDEAWDEGHRIGDDEGWRDGYDRGRDDRRRENSADGGGQQPPPRAAGHDADSRSAEGPPVAVPGRTIYPELAALAAEQDEPRPVSAGPAPDSDRELSGPRFPDVPQPAIPPVPAGHEARRAGAEGSPGPARTYPATGPVPAAWPHADDLGDEIAEEIRELHSRVDTASWRGKQEQERAEWCARNGVDYEPIEWSTA